MNFEPYEKISTHCEFWASRKDINPLWIWVASETISTHCLGPHNIRVGLLYEISIQELNLPTITTTIKQQNFGLMRIQGAQVISRISLTSKCWKSHCFYRKKSYISRMPLISPFIWHPKSGCGLIRRAWRWLPVKKTFFTSRASMLFTESKCGALLIMPCQLLRCQIKAEIKGFLLRYRLFLYHQGFFQNF